MHKFIRAYDDQPTIPARDGRKRILSTISELTPRLDPETLRVCASILASSIEPHRKIVTEEHGAGHIAGALSFLNGNDTAHCRFTKYCDNPHIDVSENVLHSSYEGKDLVPIMSPEGKEVQFMIVPLSEHYPCTSAALLRETAFKIGQYVPRAQIDKLVAEFDRCSALLGAVALYTNVPIAGAKWFPGPEAQGTAFSMEYHRGNLYPYGIQRGDTVYIIDDTVSSGGTLIGLIHLLRNTDVYIEGAVAAVQKEEYRGIDRIREETGVQVERILDVSIEGDRTRVTYDRYSA